MSTPAYNIPAGGTTYTATATDLAGNSTTASTVVTLRTTAEGLCTLTSSWVSNAGIANSLCVKLRNKAASGGTLDNYRNELSAQSGKAITSDRANSLIALSRQIG